MNERVFFPIEDFRKLMNPEFVNKNKVICIKYIRVMTGLNMKQTKDFFEEEWLPFINGGHNPPKEVKTLITDCIEFIELQRQVVQLVEEVKDLRANQTKTRAKGIFSDNKT